MPLVTFQPMGVTVNATEGATLLETALAHEVEIKTTCGGKASCRDCRVRIVEGDHAVSPVSFAEQRVLGNTYFITRERLSCQTRVLADGAVIEIPAPRQPPPKKPWRPPPRAPSSTR